MGNRFTVIVIGLALSATTLHAGLASLAAEAPSVQRQLVEAATDARLTRPVASVRGSLVKLDGAHPNSHAADRRYWALATLRRSDGYQLVDSVGRSNAALPPSVSVQARAVKGIAALLRENYPFPDIAESATSSIEMALLRGTYDGLAPEQLAERLNRDLDAVLHDRHVHVFTTAPVAVSAAPAPPRPSSLGGVSAVARLRGNVGYVEVVGFPHLELFATGADFAMTKLRGVDALIIDLRRNGGGTGISEAYLASFFFDRGRRVHLTDTVHRISGTRQFETSQSWTVPVSPSFPTVPIYVLTSRETFSAGEALAYDLKVLGRATVVGEVTGGGANPGRPYPVDDDLAIVVPNGFTRNATTGTNWEGIGVIPDVAVNADRAFAEAYRLALADRSDISVVDRPTAAAERTWPMVRKGPSPSSRRYLESVLRLLRSGGLPARSITPAFRPELAGNLSVLRDAARNAGTVAPLVFVGMEPEGEEVWSGRGGRWSVLRAPDGRLASLRYDAAQ